MVTGGNTCSGGAPMEQCRSNRVDKVRQRIIIIGIHNYYVVGLYYPIRKRSSSNRRQN